jgi:hypothetical protein
MPPARTGNAALAVTGMAWPMMFETIGVNSVNWHVIVTLAGAPIEVPDGNVGSGGADGRLQLIWAVSLVTSCRYAACAALSGRTGSQAFGYCAA